MADTKFCHEPISQGHYCHKLCGHVVNKDQKDRSDRERRASTHVCNCRGVPSLEATHPGE